jgi:catechol 2,3-dioxygenase-like lactoylglutathione lyase family enzyme
MVTVIDRGASRPRRKDPQMLRGLTTVSFFADDLDAAKKWYTELLGIDPYFERPVAGPPAYIEFRLGDYHHELGVIDSRYAAPRFGTRPGWCGRVLARRRRHSNSREAAVYGSERAPDAHRPR